MQITKFFFHHSVNLLNISILIARLTIGVLIAYHGYEKLVSFDTYAVQFPDPLNIGSVLSLRLVVFSEFFGGLGLILGVLTRFFAFSLLLTMVVAVFIVHAQDIFQMKELAIIYMLISVSILVSGGGKYSLDNIIQKILIKKI